MPARRSAPSSAPSPEAAKGAAIEAGAGAGAGTLTQIVTKGSIKVPVETVLTFKLDRPLRVVAE